MTTKEFVTKHYGSLSAGLFGIGLLIVLALYGTGFNAFTTGTVKQPAPAETVVVPASEQVPVQPDEAIAQDETAEPEKDPLEQAIAAEAAKAEERREAVREEIAKEREEAGLPPLPPREASDASAG